MGNTPGGGGAEADARRYRAGYPDQHDEDYGEENYRFYSGKISSKPSGDFIDEIHKKWWGDYRLLEAHHGYIQWLFPIREHGMNSESSPLTKKEIAKMKDDEKIKQRLIKSYQLILDFYGMKLVEPFTGELERTSNYQERYDNLDWSSHNWLRVTRILKCLGELGFENWKKGFCEHIASEIFEHGALKRCLGSLKNYWIPVLRNDQERKALFDRIEDYEEKARAERNPHNTTKDEDFGITRTIVKINTNSEKTKVDDSSKNDSITPTAHPESSTTKSDDAMHVDTAPNDNREKKDNTQEKKDNNTNDTIKEDADHDSHDAVRVIS